MSDTFDHEADAYDSLMDSLEEAGADFLFSKKKPKKKKQEDRIEDDYVDNDYHPEPKKKLAFHPQSKTITCKFCGENGFHWNRENDKWLLYDTEGNQHICASATKPNDNELKVMRGLVYHYTQEEPNESDTMNKMLLRVLIEMSERIELLTEELIKK